MEYYQIQMNEVGPCLSSVSPVSPYFSDFSPFLGMIRIARPSFEAEMVLRVNLKE